MEKKIVYFEDTKKDNTIETFQIAEAGLKEIRFACFEENENL